MSDYVRGLVDRSLDPAGSVRPRVPSLFEPTAPWTSSEDVAPIESADETEASERRGSRADDEPAPRRARIANVEPARAPVAPTRRLDAPTGRLDAPTTFEPTAPAPRSTSRDAEPVRAIASRPSNAIRDDEAARIVATEPRVLERTIERRVEERARAHSAAPAPVDVRVSIGRIEVRAVHPPAVAPAPAAERAKGLMTLEEYMARREGRS